MSEIALFAAIYIIGEALAYIIFLFVKKNFEGRWRWQVDRQTIKGWLERIFLYLCLVYDLPHALIAFGAIKIGTRVSDHDDHDGDDDGDANHDDCHVHDHMDFRVSNDYFFIGNIVSLLLVVVYYAVWLFLTK